MFSSRKSFLPSFLLSFFPSFPPSFQLCPFRGFKENDVVKVTAVSQEVDAFFTITAATTTTGCTITVYPAPNTATAENAVFKLLRTRTPYHGARGLTTALQALPNRVLEEIEVTETRTSPANHSYSIAMNGTHVTGVQKLLEVNVDGCDVDGCQPRYGGMHSIIPRLTLNADDGVDNCAVTFAQVGVAGGREDTITIAGALTPFANRFAVGDKISVSGSNTNLLNAGRTYVCL